MRRCFKRKKTKPNLTRCVYCKSIRIIVYLLLVIIHVKMLCFIQSNIVYNLICITVSTVDKFPKVVTHKISLKPHCMFYGIV